MYRNKFRSDVYYTRGCACMPPVFFSWELRENFYEGRTGSREGWMNLLCPMATQQFHHYGLETSHRIKCCFLLMHVFNLIYIYSTIPRNKTSVLRILRNQSNRKIPESVSIKRPRLNGLHAIIYIWILQLFVFPLLKCSLQEPLLPQDLSSLFLAN